MVLCRGKKQHQLSKRKQTVSKQTNKAVLRGAVKDSQEEGRAGLSLLKQTGSRSTEERVCVQETLYQSHLL